MIRAALYARVSTDEQAERYGLSSQITELQGLAASKAYTIPDGGEYVDDGYSGADMDRPALNRLRDAVRAGAFDVLLIHDPDRLSRSLAHLLLLHEEFEAHVRLEYLTTPKEDTAEGRLLLNVKGVVAAYEREKIRDRTLRGKREKARRGQLPHGQAPYGYRKDAESRMVIDETEAQVIRGVFRAVTEEGQSVRRIAIALNQAGVRSPRSAHWVPSQVKRLLSNEVYIGRAWYNRHRCRGKEHRLRPRSEWIPIPVPAIVSEAVFERAQAQLRRNRAVLSGRPSAMFYLLRGLIKCGHCGGSWHGFSSRGRRYYRCTSHQRWYYMEKCPTRMWPADDLEATIWEAATAILKDPESVTRQLEVYRAKLGVRDVEVKSEATHIERQLIEVRRQERKLLDLYLGDDESPEIIRSKLDDLQCRREILTVRGEEIRVALARQEASTTHQDAVKAYCQTVFRGLGALAPEGRLQLLRTLVDKIVMAKDGAVEFHGLLPTPQSAPAKDTVPNVSMTGVTASCAAALTATAAASHDRHPRSQRSAVIGTAR